MGSDSAVGVGFWGRKGLIYTVLETLFVKYLRLVFGLDCPVSLKDRVHYQTALQSMQ